MKCYQCGQPGRAFGQWVTAARRIVWIRFRCHNDACRFEYQGLDGQTRKAQPTWMAPKAEVSP